MNHVAAAFAYPFRRGCLPSWIIGIPLLVLLPLGIVPLSGYAVAAIRSSRLDPEACPPPWRSPLKLLREGGGVVLLGAALSLPFAVLVVLAGRALAPRLTAVPGATDSTIALLVGCVVSLAVIGLPWGILLLVLMPAAMVRLAAGGRLRDLFDLPAALGLVRRDFAAWNLVAVAIVTAWAVGFAGVGLAGFGAIPGAYFAVLASAHAASTLHD